MTIPPKTSKQVLQQQTRDAEREQALLRTMARKAGTVPPPSKPTNGGTAVSVAAGTAVAAPDNRTPQQQYIDAIAPASFAGRLVKFDKSGKFITVDDGEEVPEDAEFVALCDETLIGWLKFRGEGEPPDRVAGLLYGGFVMPARETLGDTDESKWPTGLSGGPQDPWLHQVLLPLQHADTKELYTFGTTSLTGRRAVGNLLRSFDRMQRANRDELPVIKLKIGGFAHRDERIGWVAVPVLTAVGRAKRGDAARPDTSSNSDLNDEIPF